MMYPFQKPAPPQLDALGMPIWLLNAEARREYEKEYWRHPRVRSCPGCEDAVMDEQDPNAECTVHGSPYEEPFEFEFRFHELFGRFPWEETEEAK
jgi:hypothetical protein